MANSTSTSAGDDGTTTTSRYRTDTATVFVHSPRSSSINRYRIDARSLSTVSAGTLRRNPNRRVQGMGILKPIHVGILKHQIHPYPVMECSFRPKNFVMKNKKKKEKKKRKETQKPEPSERRKKKRKKKEKKRNRKNNGD